MADTAEAFDYTLTLKDGTEFGKPGKAEIPVKVSKRGDYLVTNVPVCGLTDLTFPKKGVIFHNAKLTTPAGKAFDPVKVYYDGWGFAGDVTVDTYEDSVEEGTGYLSLAVTKDDAADTVVEEGTEGAVTWRKWASGLAEMWGSRTYNLADYQAQVLVPSYVTEAWVSTATWEALDCPIPDIFTQIDAATVSGHPASGSGLVGRVHPVPGHVYFTPAIFRGTLNTRFTLYFELKGRWKA